MTMKLVIRAGLLILLKGLLINQEFIEKNHYLQKRRDAKRCNV